MENVPKITQALCDVMKEIGAVGKSQQADLGRGGKYKFRGIDDVYNAIQPALVKCGVAVEPKVVNIERQERVSENEWNGKVTKKVTTVTVVQMEFRFICVEDGTFITSSTVGEAFDSSDKGCNKAMSAAYKYAMFQTFCIPTEEHKDTEQDNIQLDAKPDPAIKARLDAGKKYVKEAFAGMTQPDIDAIVKSADLPDSVALQSVDDMDFKTLGKLGAELAKGAK